MRGSSQISRGVYGSVAVRGAVRSIVLSAVREEGSATEVVDTVLRMINWSIRKDVVVAVSSSRWGSPPSEKFSRYLHAAAPALRRRTHVSAFALVVYWHDPDGTPIAAYQVPGLHHVEVQRPIFEAQ